MSDQIKISDIAKISLIIEGKNAQGKQESDLIPLEIVQSTIDAKGFKIAPSHASCGMFSYDPSYMSTASCTSSITYIDGMNGVLKYRGYDIENLIDKCNFVQVCYLLLYGTMPTKTELKNFENKLNKHYKIDETEAERLANVIAGFAEDAHPMGMLIAILAQLSTTVKQSIVNITEEEIDDCCISAVAKMFAIVPIIYRKTTGQKLVRPYPDRSGKTILENFLHEMFDGESSDAVTKALDKILILHADHEQNASTSVVRSVGSTKVNLFASLCGGASALWGPLHGGANEQAVKMLQELHLDDVEKMIEEVKLGKKKLSGFGHRIYKNYDPRAAALKQYCDSVMKDIGVKTEMMQLAQKIEKTALNDEYFIKRKLFPNVDFYSGIMYHAMKIPNNMFVVMFALGRTIGWVSQWKEMVLSGDKITRPRQIYTGKTNEKIS